MNKELKEKENKSTNKQRKLNHVKPTQNLTPPKLKLGYVTNI